MGDGVPMKFLNEAEKLSQGGGVYTITFENYFPSSTNAEYIQEELPYGISVSDGIPIVESRIPSHQLIKYPHDGILSGRALFNDLKFANMYIGKV